MWIKQFIFVFIVTPLLAFPILGAASENRTLFSDESALKVGYGVTNALTSVVSSAIRFVCNSLKITPGKDFLNVIGNAGIGNAGDIIGDERIGGVHFQGRQMNIGTDVVGADTAPNQSESANARPETETETVLNRPISGFIKIGMAILVTAVGCYSLKYIYTKVTTPKLKIEQSESAVWSFFKYKVFRQKRKRTVEQLAVPPKIKRDLMQYRDTLFSAHKNKTFMTNLLLYGTLGTDKVEIARRIAKDNNSTLIHFSGDSLSNFEESKVIDKMKKTFNWASKKGNTIIFIDRIENLLSLQLDETKKQRNNSLIKFLAQTKNKSSKFAIIAATASPSTINEASIALFDKIIGIDFF